MGDEHPYIKLYDYVEEDKWLSRAEIGEQMKLGGDNIHGKYKRRALEYLRKHGLIEFRIRSITPLKGFTVADVLKKLEVGTAKLNTGTVMYEYRRLAFDAEEREEIWERLRYWARCHANPKKKKKKPEYNVQRKLTPEEAMYVMLNPDKVTIAALARMFKVTPTTISGIQKRTKYKDLDMEKYYPIREEIFKSIRSNS